MRDRREFSTTLEAREKGQSIFNLRVKITKVVYFVFATPLVGCCFWMNGIQEKVFLRKKKGHDQGRENQSAVDGRVFFLSSDAGFPLNEQQQQHKKREEKENSPVTSPRQRHVRQ